MDRFATTLTAEEERICTWVGRMRFRAARKANRNPGRGPSPEGDHHNIRGAKCEYALSLIVNLYWRPNIGNIHGRDVGGLLETRTADLRRGRLIIKPRDIEKGAAVPYCLISCLPGEPYRLLGWRLANEAKDLGQWLTEFGDPAFYIAQSDLRTPASLLEWIAQHRHRR